MAGEQKGCALALVKCSETVRQWVADNSGLRTWWRFSPLTPLPGSAFEREFKYHQPTLSHILMRIWTLVLWSGRPRFDISVPGQATAMTPLVLCHSWASFACFYDLLRVNTLWTFKQIQSEPTSISIQYIDQWMFLHETCVDAACDMRSHILHWFDLGWPSWVRYSSMMFDESMKSMDLPNRISLLCF